MRYPVNKLKFLCLLTILSPFLSYANDWRGQVSIGQLHQDYQEIDNNERTSDGVFNKETGNIPTFSLFLIKGLNEQQIGNTNWTPYGKLGLRYANGESDYDGYLQYGNTLIPYQATTDNRIIRASLAFGASKTITDYLTLTPILAISHYQWQRDLEQYTEDFRHTALSAGASIDWKPSQTLPLILQATGQTGKIIDSEVDVPYLGLNQDIGNASIRKIGANARYQLANNITLNAGIHHEQWQYEQSGIENGYLYPESESEQTNWEVGLGWKF